jgi:hypothetical protein
MTFWRKFFILKKHESYDNFFFVLNKFKKWRKFTTQKINKISRSALLIGQGDDDILLCIMCSVDGGTIDTIYVGCGKE